MSVWPSIGSRITEWRNSPPYLLYHQETGRRGEKRMSVSFAGEYTGGVGSYRCSILFAVFSYPKCRLYKPQFEVCAVKYHIFGVVDMLYADRYPDKNMAVHSVKES